MKLGILVLAVPVITFIAFMLFVIFGDLENKQYEIKEFIQLEET